MELIDRIFVSNQAFVSSVLKKIADTRNLPDTAVSHMQLAEVLRELFRELGATKEMADEYFGKVLRTLPPKYRETLILSDGLQTFLDTKVDTGLLHKYNLDADDLYRTWSFENLEDVSTLEHLNLGAETRCEHHTRWEQEYRQSKKALDDEFAKRHELDLDLLNIPQPKKKETDALLEL